MSEKSKNKKFSSNAFLIAVFGIIALVASYVLIRFEILSTLNTFIVTGLSYLFFVLIIALIKTISISRNKRMFDEIESNFEIVTKGFLDGISNPVVMCDNDGKIIWYNNEFITQTGKIGPLYSGYIDALTDATIDKIVKEEDPKGTYVSFFGVKTPIRYRAKGIKVKSGKNEYNMVIFISNQEVDNLTKLLEDEDTIVSILTIDNIDDVAKRTDETIDMIIVNISNTLRSFAYDIHGIIRDSGKNKYLLLFSRKYLQDLIANKFEIIDQVRRLSEGIDIPITISLGLADVKGSLDNKYAYASQALELALQRGGDQAVVKTSEGSTFYGGKTRGVQRTTKVRARVIANEFFSLIKSSSNVLIMGHRNADFDAIASCIGIARICTYAKVRANVICNKADVNIQSVYSLLKTAEYERMLVDSSEAQDLIQSNTLCVLSDINNLAICEAPDVVNNCSKIVIIDHHRKTQDYSFTPEIQYIEPNASSASELVSEFLEQLLPITTIPKVEANLLFAGILLDTKKLTHNAGIRTFGALQYLRNVDADPGEVEELFKVSLKELSNEAQYEANMVVYKSVIAIAFNDNDENTPNARVIAARAADKMLTVTGILASFALCRIGDSIHISARSTGKINVQLILEKMGGGGHFDSAGASIQNVSKKSVSDALRKAIDEYFEEPTKK